MIKNEKDLSFQQLITKIDVCNFQSYVNNRRVIFLSKGILIAHNDKINFYDFKKYSKTFIKSIKEEDKKYIKISKLLDDKFCICTKNGSFIYQFNNDNFTIILLKMINVDLNYLKELEKDVYINSTEKFIYIWKQLKSVFKYDDKIVLISRIILAYFILKLFPENINTFLYYLILIFTIILLDFLFYKYIYLINPYKRMKNNTIVQIEKCGNNLCCIKSYNNIVIFNYIKNKSIKEIISSIEEPYFWYFIIYNENLILFINKINRRMKIYDINKNKIIKNDFNDINLSLKYTFNVGNDIFITIQDDEVVKWKYDFDNKEINIINKIKGRLLEKDCVKMEIVDNKLFILRQKYIGQNLDDKLINLYIYK